MEAANLERLNEVRAAIEGGIFEVLTAAERKEIGLACVNHAIVAGKAMLYANAAVLTALGIIAGEEIVEPIAQEAVRLKPPIPTAPPVRLVVDNT
jgi:hypothetical protein